MPGQIEWFHNKCEDKSYCVGGKQVIIFLEGYATPLQCRSGLIFMSLLGKPTDKDMETYPLVLLSGPHELDLSVLDYTHPNKEKWKAHTKGTTGNTMMEKSLLWVPC